jgi:hypothetical protein
MDVCPQVCLSVDKLLSAGVPTLPHTTFELEGIVSYDMKLCMCELHHPTIHITTDMFILDILLPLATYYNMRSCGVLFASIVTILVLYGRLKIDICTGKYNSAFVLDS